MNLEIGFLYLLFENSTTCIAIVFSHFPHELIEKARGKERKETKRETCPIHQSTLVCPQLWGLKNLTRFFPNTVEIRSLRRNQNMTIVCQNLTGMTYIQFFWP